MVGTTTTTATGPGGGDDGSRTSCPRGGGVGGAGAAAHGRGDGDGDGDGGGGVGDGAAAAAAAVGGARGADDANDDYSYCSVRCQRPQCRHRYSPWRPPVAAQQAAGRPRPHRRSTGRRMRPATPNPRIRSSFTRAVAAARVRRRVPDGGGPDRSSTGGVAVLLNRRDLPSNTHHRTM